MAQTRNPQQPNPSARQGLNREQLRRGMGNTPAPPARSASPPLLGSGGRGRLGRNGILEYLRTTRSELRKVTWPSVNETRNLTIVVIAMAIVVGAVLGLADYGFQEFFKFLLSLTGNG